MLQLLLSSNRILQAREARRNIIFIRGLSINLNQLNLCKLTDPNQVRAFLT